MEMETTNKLNDILEKKNLERYILDDNPLIAYFATAFAGHDLLYKLIQTGSIEQKINVIEHGSSKHVKIMLDDYNTIIRDRAYKKAVDLEKNIYHEYVSAEKMEVLFSPYTTNMQLDFFTRETNPFIKEIYLTSKKRDDLHDLMVNEVFIEKVISSIELTDTEMLNEIEIALEKSGAANAIVNEEIKKSKEFISKYNFTFKIEHCYQVGYLIISKDNKNLLNLPVNYSYHNEGNPLIFIFIRDAILEIIGDALDVYNTSLDQCDFSSVESFQEYRAKRLFVQKLGFTKEELSKILEENCKY